MPETKVTADELLSGNVRQRVGGDPDDFSAPGTTVYDENRKNMQEFIGCSMSTAGTVTVTFPTAFASPPIVVANVLGSTLGTASLKSVSATGFTFQANNLLGVLTASLPVLWIAKGRRVMS